jgi:hypothetical protein
MITADSYTAPGRRPSPAALALLVQCRKAKALAQSAQVVFRTETPRPVASAAGGEVTIVVQPTTLAEWQRWTQRLGVRKPGKSTGTQLVVRCWFGGVRTRLVGVGVPALLAAEVSA